MLKEHSSFVKQGIALFDCLMLASTFFVAYQIVGFYKPLSPILTYWVMYVGFLAFYLYFAWTRELFSIQQFTFMQSFGRRIVAIFVTAGVIGAAVLYLMPDQFNSRSLYTLFVILSFGALALEKYCLKWGFSFIRRHGRNTTPVILFGRGRQAAHIIKKIQAHPEWGFRIVRKVDLAISPAEFEEIIKSSYVDEVFFCIPRSMTRSGFKIDTYLQICEEIGRPARVFLNLPNATNFARWEYHKFLDFPSLISHTVELDPDQLFFKRCFDIAGSLVGLAILFAVYPFCFVAMKIMAPGPIFFKQVRVGKNGKRFIIYKFRSMHMDAEERKKELMAKNEAKGAIFKIKDDPRITPIGRILRKYSLDELPQFINVLRGEMSLVGTRPPTPDEVDKYEKWHHRRISVNPGITGLWQVSGRSKISDFDEIVRLDLKYIDMWSVSLDIKIIIKTIFVIFERDAAF